LFEPSNISIFGGLLKTKKEVERKEEVHQSGFSLHTTTAPLHISVECGERRRGGVEAVRKAGGLRGLYEWRVYI
jgi:hypothetical protein